MDLLVSTIATIPHTYERLHSPEIVLIAVIVVVVAAAVLPPIRTLHRHVRLCVQPRNVSDLASLDLHPIHQ